MSGMNLSPTPAVILVQAGLFLASVYSVKRLFVEPYLRLKDKRDHATISQKAKAQELVLQNEELASTVHAKFESAKDQVHAQVAEIREEMKSKREELLGVADSKAREMLTKVRVEIAAVLDEERKKMSASIPKLTEQLYQKTLN